MGEIVTMNSDGTENWIMIYKLDTEDDLIARVVVCNAVGFELVAQQHATGRVADSFTTIAQPSADALDVVMNATIGGDEFTRVESWERRGSVWSRTVPPRFVAGVGIGCPV